MLYGYWARLVSICSGPWVCEAGLDAVLPVPDACRDWDGDDWFRVVFFWFASALSGDL